jgi:roadblock/LC7 domain-containing protein
MARLRVNSTGVISTLGADFASLKTSLAAALVTANTDIATAKADATSAADTTTISDLTTVQTDMTAVGVISAAIVGTADVIVDVNLAVVTSVAQLQSILAAVVQRFKEQGLT